MCDFRVGDEVVCVHTTLGPPDDGIEPCHPGETFTVRDVCADEDGVWIELSHREPGQLFYAGCFRKVQRRDLTAWLNQSVGNTDKLDKRQPKKVRA